MAKQRARHLTPAPADDTPVSRGRNLVVVIGINNYSHWPQLTNAVNDARGVQRLFVDKLGFISPLGPLEDTAASRDAIAALIQDDLPPLLQPDDNLVIFFAGHGHTRVQRIADAEVETGYIIPYEARTDHFSDYIKIDTLLEDASTLPARHVLLILDACRSGFALGSAMVRFRAAVQYEEDLVKRTSRKVITSARRDQDAVDSGPVAGHSLFTGTLVQGFDWGTADADANGLVTSFELGLYLQQRVGQASDSRQTPDFGSFALDDRGEMVISLRDNNFDAVKARAFTALRQLDLPTFRTLMAQIRALRPDSPETHYLQYRLCLAEGQIEQAATQIDELRQMQFAAGTIPLSDQDLVDLSVQLRFWAQALAMPLTPLPVEVTMLVRGKSGRFGKARTAAFAQGRAYQIPNGATARYRVRNPTLSPAHLYFIAITGRGTLRMGPLFENDSERIDGLPPGAVGIGPAFLIKGPPAICETRILYSPQRVSDMLFPPTVSMRSARSPLGPEVAAVKSTSLWHKILSQEAAEDQDYL